MRSACLVRTRSILNNFLVGLDWVGSHDPQDPPGYAHLLLLFSFAVLQFLFVVSVQ